MGKIKPNITSMHCKQQFLTPQTLLFWHEHQNSVPSSVLHLPECTVICWSFTTNHSSINGCPVDGWYGNVCLNRTTLEYVLPLLVHPKTDQLTIVLWRGLPWECIPPLLVLPLPTLVASCLNPQHNPRISQLYPAPWVCPDSTLLQSQLQPCWLCRKYQQNNEPHSIPLIA